MPPPHPLPTEEFREQLLEWAESNLREFPWRDPQSSIYEVFVAEFFLTQTPAENVEVVYEEFLEDYPSLEEIDAAALESLRDDIEPLGFQNQRARALDRIAEEYDDVPRRADELRELPRVGPYVADATLCFATGEPLAVRDRNVDRVYARLLGATWQEWTERDRDEFAKQCLDGVDPREYQYALLDLGGSLCTARDPGCGDCPVSDVCAYPQ